MKVSELIERLKWMPMDDDVVDSFTDRKIDGVYADPDKNVTYVS